MNLIKIYTVTFCISLLVYSHHTSANLMAFDFQYDFISGNHLKGSFIGDLQTDNETIVDIHSFSAWYSAVPLLFQTMPSTNIATLSGNAPLSLITYSPTNNLAGFELSAGGLSVIQGGDTLGTVWESEIFSGDRWAITSKPIDVPEPTSIALIALALTGLRIRRKS